jgi:hypothetical protein
VTGAQIANIVQMRSSVNKVIEGDNFDPIDIFLRLSARLVNWGSSDASSGSASATGYAATSGGGTTLAGSTGSIVNQSATTANSGAVRSTGLLVQNSVNLFADVWLDIRGSNFADINIHVLFDTWIDNSGEAKAVSGNASATGGDATVQTAGAAGSGGGGDASGAASLPAALRLSAAAGGATEHTGAATAGNGTGTVGGTTAATGTGAGALASNEQSSTLRLAATSNSTTGSTTGGTTVSLTNQSGASAASGNAQSGGVDSSIGAFNAQVASVPGLGPNSSAAQNVATFKVCTNGSANASSGHASTDVLPSGSTSGPLEVPSPETACPTPTSTPSPQQNTSPSNTATPQVTSHTSDQPAPRSQPPSPTARPGQYQSVEIKPDDSSLTRARVPGTFVQVNPWPDAGGDALPPLPGQPPRRPIPGTLVEVDPWSGPGVGRPPIPIVYRPTPNQESSRLPGTGGGLGAGLALRLALSGAMVVAGLALAHGPRVRRQRRNLVERRRRRPAGPPNRGRR